MYKIWVLWLILMYRNPFWNIFFENVLKGSYWPLCIVSKMIIASLEFFVIFRDIAGVIYFCFINFQSFEITTLWRPNCACSLLTAGLEFDGDQSHHWWFTLYLPSMFQGQPLAFLCHLAKLDIPRFLVPWLIFQQLLLNETNLKMGGYF